MNTAKSTPILLLAATIAIQTSQLFAAEPFLEGYRLNENRDIKFTQALPRMNNAATGNRTKGTALLHRL